MSWIRITLTPPTLQIQSAGFSRSVSLTDTINLAATEGYFFAMVRQHRTAINAAGEARLEARRYAGSIKVFVAGNELCAVNLTPVDDYLAGVLAAEMPQADLAALQAQAVVSRTYLVKYDQRHQRAGYQFCDLTHCQTYKGSDGVTAKIKRAVVATKDEILTFAHQPITAYYSSTCGGFTADDAGVWTKTADQPYLRSITDAANQLDFCRNSPHYQWRSRLPADSLHQIWRQRLGEPITSIAITKKGVDGRVRELALIGHSLHLLSGEDFRAVTCRAFGWNTLKSTAFDLQIEKNAYIFEGRGLGHGLGLCQYGTMEMARQGYTYQEILRHFFPGTEIRKYKEKF
ncbi:MAG: SpoIID/LytB domain-containing protein [candidate division KSB1 bacterium]|nr:SpoIID/LytB domain-containing protein [candidate division KSB1 bacterium]MDZ7368167.1 SpoIID/LytB domain-containing protein [candidate division KSB1 bacterium]MDZ7405942.1 SpoIID/LytB domain-containing protein [candidate division KSB1 bacterium]